MTKLQTRINEHKETIELGQEILNQRNDLIDALTEIQKLADKYDGHPVLSAISDICKNHLGRIKTSRLFVANLKTHS